MKHEIATYEVHTPKKESDSIATHTLSLLITSTSHLQKLLLIYHALQFVSFLFTFVVFSYFSSKRLKSG